MARPTEFEHAASDDAREKRLRLTDFHRCSPTLIHFRFSIFNFYGPLHDCRGSGFAGLAGTGGGAFLPLCITFRPARCGRNGEMATGVLLG